MLYSPPDGSMKWPLKRQAVVILLDWFTSEDFRNVVYAADRGQGFPGHAGNGEYKGFDFWAWSGIYDICRSHDLSSCVFSGLWSPQI